MRKLWLALVIGCWLNAQAVVVRDDRQQVIDLPQAPQRVVSLLPSLTETVCALGACERLVGVDRYSNWPASVQSLPRVGGGLDPSIEGIVALRPDLVLAAGSTRGAAWPRWHRLCTCLHRRAIAFGNIFKTAYRRRCCRCNRQRGKAACMWKSAQRLMARVRRLSLVRLCIAWVGATSCLRPWGLSLWSTLSWW